MSLIKAADVSKHLAERLQSRRIAARLSGGNPEHPLPNKPAAPVETSATELPTRPPFSRENLFLDPSAGAERRLHETHSSRELGR